MVFSVDRVGGILSPVCVIHGTEDKVVDVCHGKALYARCRHKLEPLWLQGAGHNDVDGHERYFERLRQLVADISMVQEVDSN